MPRRCLVLGCPGNYCGGPKVRCFSFPSNDELRRKWLEIVPLKHPTAKKNSKVCELHFADSDLVKTVSGIDAKTGKTIEYALDQIRLKKDAVPSIFPDPQNNSLHRHGRQKKIKDDEEDLNLSDSAAINNDALENSSESVQNKWEKDETSALIALYELEPCLYDRRDKNYRNNNERNNAYYRIQQVMTYIRPTCTLKQVKKKIIKLRNHYGNEKLFKDRSICSGLCTEDTYKPSLWYFRLLQFLDDHIIHTGRRTYKKVLIEDEVNNEFSEDEKNFQDCPETNNLIEKQNISGESDGDKDEEIIRLKTSDEISDSNEQNMSGEESDGDKDENSTRLMKQNMSSEESDEDKDEDSKRLMKINVTEKSIADKDEDNEMLITSSETVVENHEDELNKELDNDSCESFKDDHQNFEASRREKRKLDISVSTSKKVKAQGKYDQEDCFGRYVSDEMKTLKYNPLLHLKTKQSILKVLTEANFKLINPDC